MMKLTEQQKDEIIEAAVIAKLHYDTRFEDFTAVTRPIWRASVGTMWKYWDRIPNPAEYFSEVQVKPAKTPWVVLVMARFLFIKNALVKAVTA